MSERRRYVSPEYQAQLDELAEHLVNPARFGKSAVEQMVLFERDEDLEDTQEIPIVVLGEE